MKAHSGRMRKSNFLCEQAKRQADVEEGRGHGEIANPSAMVVGSRFA